MQKRYLFTPGPDAGAARGARRRGRADGPPPRRRLPRGLRAHARSGSRRSTAREGQVLLFAASGTGAMESAVANLTRAGRPGRDRRRRRVRRALDEDLRRSTGSTSRASTTSGARCPTRPRSRRRSRESGRRHRLLHPVRDLDRRRRRRPGDQGGRRRRHARGRRRLLARRGAARHGRVGDRRRRLRLAEGADVPARPRDGRGRRPPLGRPCRRRGPSTSTGARPGRRRRSSTPRSRRPSR